MGRWIANLDWGSSALKTCAFLKKRPGQDRVLLLGGALRDKQLAPFPSPRMDSGRSVKAAFLTGELSPEALPEFEVMSESALSECMVAPLATHLREDPTPVELFLNLHVPLQLTSPAFLACSEVFSPLDSDSRAVVPAYRTLEDWTRVLKRPQQPIECRWALWIMERIQTLWMREGLDANILQLALIPESLTCVQDMASNLAANQNRQFLILDVGHFTTDYTLVAFVHSGTEKTFIRQAGSFFDMGSESMTRMGFPAWLDMLGKNMARRMTPVSERGIEAYMNLEVLLAGGGSLGFQETHRRHLKETVLGWARRNALFASAPSRGKGRVELNVPLHRSDAFMCLGPIEATPYTLDRVRADVFLPAIAACGFADARTSLNIPGSDSWAHLREQWHRTHSRIATVASVETRPRSLSEEPPNEKLKAPTQSQYFTQVVATPQKSRIARLEDAYRALSGPADSRLWGLHVLTRFIEAGDPHAMYLLGRFEAIGDPDSGPRNRSKGLSLLKRAASLGHGRARKALGYLQNKARP